MLNWIFEKGSTSLFDDSLCTNPKPPEAGPQRYRYRLNCPAPKRPTVGEIPNHKVCVRSCEGTV